jgi:hypothetical protein
MCGDPHCRVSNAGPALPRPTRMPKGGCYGKGRCLIVSLRSYKRKFFSAISIEACKAEKTSKNELRIFTTKKWSDGNAAGPAGNLISLQLERNDQKQKTV